MHNYDNNGDLLNNIFFLFFGGIVSVNLWAKNSTLQMETVFEVVFEFSADEFYSKSSHTDDNVMNVGLINGYILGFFLK